MANVKKTAAKPIGPPAPGSVVPQPTRASRFRTYFLTGVVVAMPIAITVYIRSRSPASACWSPSSA
jgi:hypothetical protein